MIKVGIVGSSGYVAGELIRLLVNHPKIELDFLYSHSNSGKTVSEIHQDLFAYDNLVFSNKINENIDVLFLCLGHGNSKKFLSKNPFAESTKIIDLSNDFRLKKDAHFEGKKFHYGLVEKEIDKSNIETQHYIANPGCFATAIQLALLPLAQAGLLKNDIHVNGITGATGAGQSLTDSSHFSWRNNNISMYKEFKHKHLDEIKETISGLQSGFDSDIHFLPVRGDFTRGIFASVYSKIDIEEEELVCLYKNFYKDSHFTKVTTDNVSLKQVVNTNYCLLQIQKVDGKVLITSVLDNLLKGAAGQAVQNMNLLFNLEETIGLSLKANNF